MSDLQGAYYFFGYGDAVDSALLQSGVAAVAALAAAAIAIWGIESQRRITRRQKTAEHISSTEKDRDVIDARRQFIKLAKASGGLTKFADMETVTDEYVDARKHIALVLNDFELIAIAIQEGVMDKPFYYKFHRGAVLKYWYHAAPFVYELRGKTGNKRVFHEFEELARSFDTDIPPKRTFLPPRV